MYRLNYVKFLSYSLAVLLALLQIIPHFAGDLEGHVAIFPAAPPPQDPGPQKSPIKIEEVWTEEIPEYESEKDDTAEKAHRIMLNAVNMNSRDAIFKWKNGNWVMLQSWNGKPLPDTREIVCPHGHGVVVARKKKGIYIGGSVPPARDGYEGELYHAPYIFYTTYVGICHYRENGERVISDTIVVENEDTSSPDSLPDGKSKRNPQTPEISSRDRSIEFYVRTAVDDRLRLYCKADEAIIKIEATVFKDTPYEKTISLNQTAGNSGLWTGECDYREVDLPNGEYTTLFHGYTNAGEDVFKECSNPFLFLKVEHAEINGDWNKWGKRRFMSYEKVKIKIRLNRDAEKVEIRFSPELESMQYTNSKGAQYDYREELGYEVIFPITANPVTEEGKFFEWEANYILPLAKSTINWNDIRISNPYKAYIKAMTKHNEVIKEMELDLTGNIHDLLYIRPLTK